MSRVRYSTTQLVRGFLHVPYGERHCSINLWSDQGKIRIFPFSAVTCTVGNNEKMEGGPLFYCPMYLLSIQWLTIPQTSHHKCVHTILLLCFGSYPQRSIETHVYTAFKPLINSPITSKVHSIYYQDRTVCATWMGRIINLLQTRIQIYTHTIVASTKCLEIQMCPRSI